MNLKSYDNWLVAIFSWPVKPAPLLPQVNDTQVIWKMEMTLPYVH